MDNVFQTRTPLEPLAEWFGGVRRPMRTTRPTTALVHCVNLLRVRERFHRKFLNDEDRTIADGLAAIAETLMDANAAHEGWDTEMMIRAAEAVSPKGSTLTPRDKGDVV